MGIKEMYKKIAAFEKLVPYILTYCRTFLPPKHKKKQAAGACFL
jgi:hypothetical protein